VKSLPLPGDVEDTSIAAVSRPSVRDVDRSSIGALRRDGKGWRFCYLIVSITDSVFSVSLKCIGLAGKTRFFAPNFLTDKRPGMYFGPLLGGTGAHILLFAIASGFRVTRVIVEFRRKFGIFFCKSGPRYSCQNFIPHGPWGSPYSAGENLDPTPKIFEKFGENFFGGGPPRGAWGQNLRGNP